jgi:AraC family transcriptional regulator
LNIKHQGVIPFESGIIEKHGIYFHEPSAFAMQNLFYALFGAEYLCSYPYKVDRKNLNAFLIFFIKTGKLHFEYRGHSFEAKENSVVLVDCNFRHSYYASEPTRFLWFHFHGCASSAYCELLYKNSGCVFDNQHNIEHYFSDILNMLPESSLADDKISVAIHKLLAELNKNNRTQAVLSPPIIKAQKFMKEHFTENISVEDAARHAALSRYHFSRQFLKETKMAPRDYLLDLRISYAKNLLVNSTDSIEQIAFKCSFYSSSNFIRAFKQKTGMTPNKFRNIA